MQINGNQVKKGDVLLIDDKLYVCIKAEHRAMGRKSAFCQAVLKNVKDGTQKDEKYAATEKLEKVDLVERAMQFLYDDGTMLNFMDNQTFEQIEIQKEFVGDKTVFLTENMNVNITFFEATPVSLRLPLTMEFDVVEADPEIKGATAQAQYKHAKLDIGLDIKVPSFVKVGDRVKINTDTYEYMERVKN